MKRITVHIPGGGGIDPFESLPEHTGNEPFIVLRDRLRDAGYQISVLTKAPVEGSDWVFVFDLRATDYPVPGSRRTRRMRDFIRVTLSPWRAAIQTFYDRCVAAGLADRLVLFAWEPPAVLPLNYEPAYHQYFHRILTWHDSWVDGKRYVKLHWPQIGKLPPIADLPFGERKLLVNFSGNKASPHPRELYSARKRTIRFFENNHPTQFDLFGPGWNREGEPPFHSWRGVVAQKWSEYPKYRFGLCYENMRDEPGWISEKLFDCLRSACVPVYWGANNVDDYVDPACLVDRRRFESEEELADFLVRMSEKEWRGYRLAGERYLRSESFRKFLPEQFADTVGSILTQ